MKNIPSYLFIASCALTIALITGFQFHPIHVSVSTIEFNERTGSLEVVHKIYIDDFEKHMEEIYEVDFNFGTDKELPEANEYIKKYLDDRFFFQLNGEKVNFNFIGKELDIEAIWVYQELENAPTAKSIEVRQEVLFGFFFDQKNIVHFEYGDLKKSFILNKQELVGRHTFTN